MAKSKTEANIHAKRYVEAVFENRLREEGFTCPDDKYLCWYRVSASEIMNTIVFHSPWERLPVELNIHYGVYPLFIKPIYTSSIMAQRNFMDNVRFCRQPLVEDCPTNNMGYIPFSSNISVYAPGREGKGIFTFDGILLPEMNRITTVEDCYLFHKQRRLAWSGNFYETTADKFHSLSSSFIDLAVWVNDVEVYPYCEISILDNINSYTHKCRRFPNRKEFLEELQHWQLLKNAISDNGRAEYLRILEQRKSENIQFISKRLNISF